MSVQVSYKKQFLLGIMFIIIILAALEVIVRIWWYEIRPFEFCEVMRSEAHANLNQGLKKQICVDTAETISYSSPTLHYEPNQHFKTININSEGFRGPEIIKQKPNGVYRLFIVGGSTVFGSGSTSDDTTISGYLQKQFESKNLNVVVEVINAGVGSALSVHEVQYIKNKLIDYEPDLFIIYDGWNDVKQPAQSYQKFKNINENQKSSTEEIYDFFRRNFSFYKTPNAVNSLIYVIDQKLIPENYHNPAYKNNLQEMIADWKNGFIEICDLGKKSDFDVLIALQPIVGTGNKTLTKGEYQWYTRVDHEDLLKAYQVYADELIELDKNCSKTVDLRNVFDGINEAIYSDTGHVGDKGNQIIAEKLFDISFPLVQERMSKNT